MTDAVRQQRLLTILCFGLVYFFWGSTYLGIDIAVEQIPPALMCGLRFSVAGALMLIYCALSRRRIVYGAKEMAHQAAVGLLLLLGGNLTLSYAEKHVASGLAALIIAITPLWFLVLDSLLLGHHRLPGRAKAGLGLGIVGVVVLLWPDLNSTSALDRPQLWASLSLLAGSFSWALGSVLAKLWKSSEVDPFAGAGWQMMAAGAGNLLVAMATHDMAHVVWTRRGLGAVLYLVICGSWIGYTAYIWLLAHVPSSKVSTYAYINPVVAVFLGWLVLHERVNGYIFAGSAIVLASVILVTSSKVEERTPSLVAVSS